MLLSTYPVIEGREKVIYTLVLKHVKPNINYALVIHYISCIFLQISCF